jgi:hypothetical protein
MPSIWPWCMPKVCLYSTFLGGLCQVIFWDRRSQFWVSLRWIMGHINFLGGTGEVDIWVITRWIMGHNDVTYWDMRSCYWDITIWIMWSCLLIRYLCWYWLVFSWYFTNQYQRKTQLVHFGIKKLAGAPFPMQKRGLWTPFGALSPPIEGKRVSRG